MARLMPEAVLRTHQISPYKDVKLMVERHGFDVREGNGTSHVMVGHPEHSDLRFTLNRSPGRIRDYQHEAAKACIEVLERSHQQEVIVKTEDDATFPDDISVKTRGSTLILRHKDYPVIGMALGFDPDKNGIADIASRRASTIREQASTLKDLLKKATVEYGVSVKLDNGHITLSSENENGEVEEIVLSPYHPLTDENPIAALESIIEDLDTRQIPDQSLWDKIKAGGLIQDISVSDHNGQPIISFSVYNDFTGNTKKISAPVASDGSISDDDQNRVAREYMSHFFEEKTFKSFQEKYGVLTTGKNTSTLRFSHPIFGLDCRAINPRSFLNTATIDDDLIDVVHNTWGEMQTFEKLVDEEMKTSKDKFKILADHIGQLGIKITPIGFKKLGHPHISRLTVPNHEDLSFEMTVATIKRSGKVNALIPSERIEDLHQFVAQVIERVAPFAVNLRKKVSAQHEQPVPFPLASTGRS